MRIQISKPTPLAMAPDALCAAINQFTEHEAFISNDPDEYADVIHFNNAYFKTDIPAVIQYHSEPTWPGLMLDCPYQKLVIAQYHATLPEYAGCKIVRNLINFHDGSYETKYVKKPRIGYSPSSTKKVGNWHDKGYEQTIPILQQIVDNHDVEVDVITGVSLSECIARKRQCNIIIDECVTGSYHRSALEGLALGKVTFCYVAEEVQKIVREITGFSLPVVNCQIKDLAGTLVYMFDKDLSQVGMQNRLWMIHNWHPTDIVEEYIKIYKAVLDEK